MNKNQKQPEKSAIAEFSELNIWWKLVVLFLSIFGIYAVIVILFTLTSSDSYEVKMLSGNKVVAGHLVSVSFNDGTSELQLSDGRHINVKGVVSVWWAGMEVTQPVPENKSFKEGAKKYWCLNDQCLRSM